MRIKKLWKKFGVKAKRDNDCTQKHINETLLHLNRWHEFWSGKEGEEEAIRFPGCKRHHLEEWRRDLLEKGLKTRKVNKHLATMRSMLVLAEKHEIIDRRPRLEQLHEVKSATKLFFRDEQLDAMFEVADKLRWPTTPIPSGLWWKCAIVMYRTYGFRTQELLAFEKNKNPITWDSISFLKETPNPDSDSVNELGWLSYVPPKTAKKKPSPIYLPLTQYTHHAMRLMEKARLSEDQPIFNNPRNAERFYKEWRYWLELANVAPKNSDARFTPYSMRKTCATYMNRHMPGLATAICRWGNSAEAKVAADHYVSDDLILFELLKAPMPISFEHFLTLSV